MNVTGTSHWVNQKEIQYVINEVKKYPVLTKLEENCLIEKIKNGDNNLKNKLIQSNLRFVIKIAKTYQNRGLPICDLVSEGSLGLIKAADKFDYMGLKLKDGQEQVRFISYAVWWIRQSILQAIYRDGRVIRLPVNYITDVYNSAKEPLTDTYHDYTLKFPKYLSFDEPVDDTGNTLNAIFNDTSVLPPDDKIDNLSINIKNNLSDIMSTLKDTERYVMVKYFGLNNNNIMTYQEIGDALNITKERVRQIKNKSLKNLRNNSCSLLAMVN